MQNKVKKIGITVIASAILGSVVTPSLVSAASIGEDQHQTDNVSSKVKING